MIYLNYTMTIILMTYKIIDVVEERLTVPKLDSVNFSDIKLILKFYATIPISFEAKTKYSITLVDQGLGGVKFEEIQVDNPYLKDYDQQEHPVK